MNGLEQGMKILKFLGIGILIFIVASYIFYRRELTGIQVEKRDYQEKIAVSGNISAEESTVLKSQVVGYIEDYYHKEGDLVKKDEIIAKFNTQEIDAQIEQGKGKIDEIKNIDLPNFLSEYRAAQDNYAIAKSELEKYRILFGKSLVSEPEYNIKKNSLILAEQKLKTAKNNYEGNGEGGAMLKIANSNLDTLIKEREKYIIRAPYDGTITRRYVNRGDTVSIGGILFSIDSSGDKYVKIDLDEKYIPNIEIGATIITYPYSDNKKSSKGKIYYISKNVNFDDGTFEIKGSLDDLLPEFIYGSSINAIILSKKINNAIVIPDKYLITDQNKNYVYLLSNSKVEKKLVEIAPSINGVIILKGLNDKDILVKPTDVKSAGTAKIKVKLEENNLKKYSLD